MLLDSIGVVLESKLPSEIFESATIGHLVCCMWPSVASCVGCLRRVTCLTYNPHNRDNPPPPPPPHFFLALATCVCRSASKKNETVESAIAYTNKQPSQYASRWMDLRVMRPSACKVCEWVITYIAHSRLDSLWRPWRPPQHSHLCFETQWEISWPASPTQVKTIHRETRQLWLTDGHKFP